MKKSIQLLLAVLIISANSFAQEAKYVPNEIIIQTKPNTNIKSWLKKYSAYNLFLKETVSKNMNIYVLGINDPRRTSNAEHSIINRLNEDPRVAVSQLNRYVQNRSLPDDSLFSEQWSLKNDGIQGGTNGIDIQAEEAWEITTGGNTIDGDTIVVAVIENGFHLTNADLNFWHNHGDSLGDGIDNDSNGYVDDYNGWNAVNENGDINTPGDNHGTHVAGIVGAKGNNGIGITGISWNTQIMAVSRKEVTTESVVLRAYNYILDQRIKYNETEGDSGAFVVSVNTSFGIDNGDPEDYPLWCGIYDSMGKAGILNVAATANRSINVDAFGDIPTACPSKYLITVTNTNASDDKYSKAAYGHTTIDMGAPGTNILSTIGTGEFGKKSGTSMATPHVTGALGLMYANVCSTSLQMKFSQPDSLAMLAKEALFKGLDYNESLDSITVTAGRLNLFKAVQNMDCDHITNSIENRELKAMDLYPNPSSQNITISNEEGIVQVELISILGNKVYHQEYPSSTSVQIDIQQLPKGMYVAIVKDKNNQLSQTKWLKN